MTLGHLFAIYLLFATIFLIGSLASNVFGAFSRPPIDGHLQVKIELGRFGKWLLGSALLVTPYVIVFAEESSRSDSLQRAVEVQGLYLALALAWIVKLQIQVSVICNQTDSRT